MDKIKTPGDTRTHNPQGGDRARFRFAGAEKNRSNDLTTDNPAAVPALTLGGIVHSWIPGTPGLPPHPWETRSTLRVPVRSDPRSTSASQLGWPPQDGQNHSSMEQPIKAFNALQSPGRHPVQTRQY